jgi:hypothetical protein
MAQMELLTVVALLQDAPDHGLAAKSGPWSRTSPGLYEVEFCDDDDRTYAMASLRGDQLIRLHHQPTHQAA